MRKYKIAIVAGEESGDILAANLIRAIKEQIDPKSIMKDRINCHPLYSLESTISKDVELIGVGGTRLTHEGLTTSFPMETLSIGGYGLDVISAIPKILYLRTKLIKQIIAFKPDVFIGVDVPDFNLYVEKMLKAAGIKTVHYVSPTIWAWRYKRVYKIKKAVDLVLCVFPFEVVIYAKEQITAKFIGHHLADQIPLDIDTQNARNKVCRDEFLKSDRVFTVLIGSRKGEIENLGGIFIATCNIIARQIKDAVFLFPLVNEESKTIFLDILKQFKVEFNYQVLVNQTSDGIKAANIVLAKSGTVTLEVALCKKPLIISYKVSKFTAWMIRRKILIKYVGLPNILLSEEVAPELLQENATPDILAKNIIDLFYDKERQTYVINKFYELHNMLRCDASKSAAIAILELVNHVS